MCVFLGSSFTPNLAPVQRQYTRSRASFAAPKLKVCSVDDRGESSFIVDPLTVQGPELVTFLQHHIAEQKRYDMTLAGRQTATDSSQSQPVVKEATPTAETFVVLPNDVKKQRKGGKGLYSNKGAAVLCLILALDAHY